MALLNQVLQPDHVKTSHIVESVFIDCQSVDVVPEYMSSLIPKDSGFEENLRRLRNERILKAALVKAEQWFRVESGSVLQGKMKS